jgi:Peptidase family M20/M25/M40
MFLYSVPSIVDSVPRKVIPPKSILSLPRLYHLRSIRVFLTVRAIVDEMKEMVPGTRYQVRTRVILCYPTPLCIPVYIVKHLFWYHLYIYYDINMTTPTTTTNTTNDCIASDVDIDDKSPALPPKSSSPSDLLQQHALTLTESEAAVDRFCQFLRFPTVSSIAATDGTYVQCAQWLLEQCQQIPVLQPQREHVFYLPEAPEHSPVVVAIWKGRDPTLPILLLNSHYDVVPAIPHHWSVPPFGGDIRDDDNSSSSSGRNIYGRGAQDMKCVGLQYLEAIRKIHVLYPDYQPERSIYLTFVPDEGKKVSSSSSSSERTCRNGSSPRATLF